MMARGAQQRFLRIRASGRLLRHKEKTMTKRREKKSNRSAVVELAARVGDSAQVKSKRACNNRGNSG